MRKLLMLALAMMMAIVPIAQADGVIPAPQDSYVYDAAEVLSPEVEAYLRMNAEALQQATGVEIYNVAMENLGNVPIDIFAHDLFVHWGIGKDDGLLLLLAIAEDDYWLMPTVGLEAQIPYAQLDEMMYTHLEPGFAVKDYEEGAMALYKALHERIAEVYGEDVPLLTLIDVQARLMTE